MKRKSYLTILFLILLGGYSAYSQVSSKVKDKRGSINTSFFSSDKGGNLLIDSTITIKNKPTIGVNIVRQSNSEWFKNRWDSIMGNTRKLDVIRSSGNELILRDSTKIIYRKK